MWMVLSGIAELSSASERCGTKDSATSAKLSPRPAMTGQPIDPEILPHLDPEYVEFHNKYIAHLPPPHTLSWDPNIRNKDAVPGAANILDVGSVKDYDLSNTKVRVFTPKGLPPARGWPVYCWYHGGQ